MNSFVLFPQALEPSMNFNISKIVYSAIHYLSAAIIYCTLFVPQSFAWPLFLISSGYYSHSRRKKKTFTGVMQKFKILWGQTRCIMRDVKIAKDLSNIFINFLK